MKSGMSLQTSAIYHSLQGQTNPRTLRLIDSLNNYKVSILLDSGSTHNFLQRDVVEYLRLPIYTIQTFLIFIGNGAHLKCERMYK